MSGNAPSTAQSPIVGPSNAVPGRLILNSEPHYLVHTMHSFVGSTPDYSLLLRIYILDSCGGEGLQIIGLEATTLEQRLQNIFAW